MARKSPEGGRIPQDETYTLSDLDQVKVLADPLRIRILEALCQQERTTKQVAQILGEKPTKLYHHVEALERVGLIRLSRTQQNRGTTEKYYLAIARTFRADSRVFHLDEKTGGKKTAAIKQMMSTIFDSTSAELNALVDRGEAGMKAIEKDGIVSFLEIHASEKDLKELRDKLHELLQSLTRMEEGPDDAGRYRLTLAYYPLEQAKRPRRKKR
jgi:DNA-binding transcriptional ArsR family regulator